MVKKWNHYHVEWAHKLLKASLRHQVWCCCAMWHRRCSVLPHDTANTPPSHNLDYNCQSFVFPPVSSARKQKLIGGGNHASKGGMLCNEGLRGSMGKNRIFCIDSTVWHIDKWAMWESEQGPLTKSSAPLCQFVEFIWIILNLLRYVKHAWYYNLQWSVDCLSISVQHSLNSHSAQYTIPPE